MFVAILASGVSGSRLPHNSREASRSLEIYALHVKVGVAYFVHFVKVLLLAA